VTDHINTGVTPVTLASGRPVAPGEVIAITGDIDPQDAALIESGVIAPVPSRKRIKE
jgi:hypothetical protein